MEGRWKEEERERSVGGHASGGASDYKTVRTYPCTLTALILSALGAKPTKGQRSTVRDRSEPSFDVDARCEGGAREGRGGVTLTNTARRVVEVVLGWAPTVREVKPNIIYSRV